MIPSLRNLSYEGRYGELVDVKIEFNALIDGNTLASLVTPTDVTKKSQIKQRFFLFFTESERDVHEQDMNGTRFRVLEITRMREEGYGRFRVRGFCVYNLSTTRVHSPLRERT